MCVAANMRRLVARAVDGIEYTLAVLFVRYNDGVWSKKETHEVKNSMMAVQKLCLGHEHYIRALCRALSPVHGPFLCLEAAEAVLSGVGPKDVRYRRAPPKVAGSWETTDHLR